MAKARGNYACGHEIKKNVTAGELAEFQVRPCQACKKAGWTPTGADATVAPMTELAGDPDAQQVDPEDTFDINEQHSEMAGQAVPLSDGDQVVSSVTIVDGEPVTASSGLVELATKMANGEPIDPSALASISKAAENMTPHTWTPGAFCRQRSRNRKTGTLVGLYDLNHPDNEAEGIVQPKSGDGEKPIQWVARCEQHGSMFFHSSVNGAWDARNKPWEWCSGCKAIVEGKATGQIVQVKKGTPNVTVKTTETKASKKGKTARAKVAKKPKPKAERGKSRKAANDAADKAVSDATPVDATAKTPRPARNSRKKNSAAADADVVTTLPQAQQAAPATTNDPEAAVWAEWSTTLAMEAPYGSSVDWERDYHYCVTLPDGRQISVVVEKGIALFTFRDESGHDTHADSLTEMLEKINGEPVTA